MMSELIGKASLFLFVAIFAGLAAITLIFKAFRSFQKERSDDGCLLPAAIFVFAAMAFTFLAYMSGGSSTVLVEEVCRGIFFDQNKNLVAEQIPENVPLVYKTEGPYGYTIQKWRWVRLISVGDSGLLQGAEWDVITYQTEKELALGGSQQVVPLTKIIESITQYTAADPRWTRDNAGKIQGEVPLLVWPKGEIQQARIVKYVFK